MMYKIYVRDRNLSRVAEITDFLSLELLPKFNDVGAWALVLPTDTKATSELIKPQAGIIVVRDGVTIFSGPVTKRSRNWNNTQDETTVSGTDDNIKLLNLAYPVPSGDFTLNAYDVRTGNAEAIMKQYTDANLGATARSERRVLTTESNQGLGGLVTGRGRFHTLLELFRSLALIGGGLGFRVVQVGTALEFQVYQPVDKTRTAFFSPLLGNLADFEYSVQAPEANYIIIGGGGEGAARIIKERGDSESIAKYGRIETFIDQRDMTDISELEQTLTEELAEKGEKTSLSITPIDTPQLTFGRDYNLGDKVSVVITQPNEVIDVDTLYYFISAYQTVPVETERVRKIQEKIDVVQDIVREIKITLSLEGERISPVVGTSDTAPRIYDRVNDLERRTSNLERR